MTDADESRRWRLVAEFLEDYRWEPPEARHALLSDASPPAGGEHWDVFLAALAEHIAARDGHPAPALASDSPAEASSRKASPAWRLLRAENAPLVLGFLHRAFVQGNARAVSAADLEALLDDELYAIRQRNPDSFPKSARAYLDDWARPEAGWLRKYYPDGIDEPHFDATPAVEKALAWVRTLGEREFVGTESRLNTSR